MLAPIPHPLHWSHQSRCASLHRPAVKPVWHGLRCHSQKKGQASFALRTSGPGFTSELVAVSSFPRRYLRRDILFRQDTAFDELILSYEPCCRRCPPPPSPCSPCSPSFPPTQSSHTQDGEVTICTRMERKSNLQLPEGWGLARTTVSHMACNGCILVRITPLCLLYVLTPVVEAEECR